MSLMYGCDYKSKEAYLLGFEQMGSGHGQLQQTQWKGKQG